MLKPGGLRLKPGCVDGGPDVACLAVGMGFPVADWGGTYNYGGVDVIVIASIIITPGGCPCAL